MASNGANLMRPMFGLLILIGCLLIAVFVILDYVMPNIVCKNLPPPSPIGSKAGQYDSQLLSNICSGIG